MAKLARPTHYRSYVFDALSKHKKIMVCDTETTGLGDDDQIIELAALTATIGKDMSINEECHIDRFIRPYKPVPVNASRVNGLTDEFLASYDTEDIAFPEISEYLETEGIFVGYNFNFDINMINNLYKRNKRICPKKEFIDVLEMVRDTVPSDKVPNYRLETIAKYLGCSGNLNFHTAIDDVRATAAVFSKCLQMYVEQYRQEKTMVKEKAGKIRKVEYFVNSHRETQQRVVVEAMAGDFFYDTIKKGWGVPSSSKLKISDFDINDLETSVLRFLNEDSMTEAVKKMKQKHSLIKKFNRKPWKIKIISANIWEKAGKARIYTKTDLDEIFFDLKVGEWKPSSWYSNLDIEKLDKNDLERQLKEIYNVPSLAYL